MSSTPRVDNAMKDLFGIDPNVFKMPGAEHLEQIPDRIKMLLKWNPPRLGYIPHAVRADAYQVGFSMAGFLPPGMENFQGSAGVYRKPLKRGDSRAVSGGIMKFVIDELVRDPIRADDLEMMDWFYKDFLAVQDGSRAPFAYDRGFFERIINEHGGRYPVTIAAMPDGLAHYIGEPHALVWSDAPGCAEAVGHLESSIGPYAFAASVVATKGRIRRQKMYEFYQNCHGESNGKSMNDELLWNLTAVFFHDFSRRSAIGGTKSTIAHCQNFLGTDTMDAAFYSTVWLNGLKKFGACSIPAAAHRTITPWPSESEAYDHHVQGNEDKMVSIVFDSYNPKVGITLLSKYANVFVEKGGKLIGRPDSGKPVDQVLMALEILATEFPVKVVDGLRIIDNAGVIQGDGIDDELLFLILEEAKRQGWSPLNIAFGMGQKNVAAERDNMSWAYKTFVAGNTSDPKGYRAVAKGSGDPLKMSLCDPVGLNLSGNGPRIYPITVEQMLNGDVGDYRIVYNNCGRDLELNPWSFDETRELTWKSWLELSPEVRDQDHIDPALREHQRKHLATMGANT